MQFLRNKNISQKLYSGFAVIICFSLFIGIFSIANIKKISDQTVNLYASPYTGVKSILTVKNDIIKIHSLMQSISMTEDKDEILAYTKEIKTIQLGVFNQFKIFEKSNLVDHDQFMNLKTQFIDWNPILEEVSNLCLADMGDIAGGITNKIGAEHVKTLNASIDELVAQAQYAADQSLKDSQLSSHQSMLVNIALLVMMIVCSIVIAAKTTTMIVPPIKSIQKATKKLAEGDLDIHVEHNHNDEIGLLAGSLTETTSTLNEYISDISRILTSMSEGNMAVSADGDYKGSFSPIKTALNQIINSLNEMLYQINTAADVTADSSQTVFSEAQKLSDAVGAQADSIVDLNLHIGQISDQAASNAGNASEASTLFTRIKESAAAGSQNMDHMLFSMSEITQSSHKIEQIVAMIDNIAKQTNLLSLNASVEAAKAGEHGKGFAVVAREVKSLSERSAKAVLETQILVEESLLKTSQGAEAADQTADSLRSIIRGIEESVDLINNIYQSSSSQSSLIESAVQIVNHILILVDQASVIASHSVEESSSLSEQAGILKEMMNHFRLK